MSKPDRSKSDRRFVWALFWLSIGISTTTTFILGSPSRAAVLFLAMLTAVSFSLAAYRFRLLTTSKGRSLILAIIWSTSGWAMWKMWPETPFTVSRGALLFAGKDRATMLWLLNGDTLCRSHVVVYLFIRNNQTADTTITDLQVEAAVENKWLDLPVIDTRAWSVLYNAGSFWEVKADFIDRELTDSIPAGGTVGGWLLLDYPQSAETVSNVPDLRIILTDQNGKTTQFIRKGRESLQLENFEMGNPVDVEGKKIINHCGSGLVW